MPFVLNDGLQHKRNQRQIREIHERDYSKFISELYQQKFHSNMSHLSYEHIKEIERSRLRNFNNKKIQYERIQQENDLLSKRLFEINTRKIIDNKYQQRLNEYKRINNENNLLIKRINNVRGQLMNKQQCEQDWQRHIKIMKKNCDYPENIDRFVSNQ